MWCIIRTPPWYVDRDVSIRNSLRSNYTIRVLVVRTPVSSLSFRVQRTSYIRPGRHAHEPSTSSASCCCNGSVGRIETHVSDTYVEVSVGGQALFLPIRRRLKEEKREKRSLQKYLVRPGAVHASTHHRYESYLARCGIR